MPGVQPTVSDPAGLVAEPRTARDATRAGGAGPDVRREFDAPAERAPGVAPGPAGEGA